MSRKKDDLRGKADDRTAAEKRGRLFNKSKTKVDPNVQGISANSRNARKKDLNLTGLDQDEEQLGNGTTIESPEKKK